MEVTSGFKQTDVGLVPADWDVALLEQCIRPEAPICYGILMPGKNHAGGIPVVKVKDIVDGRVDESGLLLTAPAIDAAYKRSRLAAGDVLISIRGTTGRVAIASSTLAGANITQDTARLRLKDSVSAPFVYYALQSATAQSQVALHTIGQAVKGINIRDVRRIAVGLPPLPEQHAIAEALSDADALIESLEQLLTKKRRLKQGAMQELLTGKKRLPGFTEAWRVASLGDVTDVDPDNLASGTRPDLAFKYISLEDVDRGVLVGHSEEVFRTAPSRARRRLRKGDVLISTVRPNLMSHLLFAGDGDDWVCSTGFSVARCRPRVASPGYVYFHMFAGYVARQIEGLLTGSNYPAINSRDVRGLRIPLPEFEEQTAIAEVLGDMEGDIAALEAKLTKARQIKQGMMQELLTGRVRLV